MFGRLSTVATIAHWREWKGDGPPKEELNEKMWYPVHIVEGGLVWLRTPRNCLWGVPQDAVKLLDNIGPMDCQY